MNRILLSLFITVVLLAAGLPAQAQPVRTDSLAISLDEAVGRAIQNSEEVRLARSQAESAQTQVTTARANLLPQINGTAGYTRTLASVFQTSGGFTLPDSLKFSPDPNLPLEERVKYLEDKTPLAGLGALGGLFSDLPFGRENIYMYGFSGQQVLYSGGRVSSGIQMARRGVEIAEANVSEQRSTMEVDVRTAYYRTLLTEEMVHISQAAVAQAEEFLKNEQLRFKAGRASDLEVMRAEVALENLRPQLVQARNANELAALNLKRLINLPLDQPLKLSTRLVVPPGDQLVVSAADVNEAIMRRPAYRMAEENIAIRGLQVRMARAAFLPNIALTTQYGRQLFPSTLFALNEPWRTDWTVGFGIQIPIFQGLKRSADVQNARLGLQQARLQLEQLREGMQLEYEQARGEKERAGATILARQRTIEAAQRVYDLTLMRYEKGLATQLEVSDARLALLQARTNLAQALSDFYIADVQLQRALGTLPAAQ